MELYAVRHCGTKNYLPAEFTRRGTWWEGEGGKTPRLFTSRLNAQRFIIKWALGRAYIDFNDRGDYEELIYLPRGRSRNDLTVVPVELIFKEASDA